MIFLDSANLEEIKEAHSYPYVLGVTTNPKLIAREMGKKEACQQEFLDYVQKLSKAVKGDLFVQTNHANPESIVAESKKIIEITGEKGIIKIPATLPGLRAMDALVRQGIRCAATAVYTGVQAHLAMTCGAEYVIPYYSRLEKSMFDGISVVRDILKIMENGVFDSNLLVASVKTSFQVLELYREGAHAITISLDLIKELTENTETEKAVSEFNNAFRII